MWHFSHVAHTFNILFGQWLHSSVYFCGFLKIWNQCAIICILLTQVPAHRAFLLCMLRYHLLFWIQHVDIRATLQLVYGRWGLDHSNGLLLLVVVVVSWLLLCKALMQMTRLQTLSCQQMSMLFRHNVYHANMPQHCMGDFRMIGCDVSNWFWKYDSVTGS